MSRGFFAELKRRNVPRSAVLYIGSVWVLAQGISELTDSVGLPEAATKWFLIAAVIGFPFWLLLSWFFEWTPEGIKRESELTPEDASSRLRSNRKIDFIIIGVLALAVVLLLTDRFITYEGIGTGVEQVAEKADKSIAVLPLANEGDKNEQYFSDGLSEGLIIALSQMQGLRVIGRNSSFQFRGSELDSKDIARKLGVSTLLEGSVQHAGDMVRISASLISAEDGSTLWAERYDRPYKDLFALQDEITQSVATALKTRLLTPENKTVQSDRPPGGDLEAYKAYLQGNQFLNFNTREDNRAAIEQYTKATRIDPEYGLAYAKLARAWIREAVSYPESPQQVRNAFSEAESAVQQALAHAPNLAATHIARGEMLVQHDWDWKGAEAAYRRAVELDAYDGETLFGLARARAALGRPAQAAELTRKALAIDPLNARWYSWLADFLLPLDRATEAEHAIGRAMQMQPLAESFHYQLATLKALQGDGAGAQAAAVGEPEGPWGDFALAMAAQVGPDKARADTLLRVATAKYGDEWAFQIARAYALRRDADQTFAWLERAYEAHDPGVQALLYDPLLLRFKDDPRFAAFAGKLGLPAPEVQALP